MYRIFVCSVLPIFSIILNLPKPTIPTCRVISPNIACHAEPVEACHPELAEACHAEPVEACHPELAEACHAEPVEASPIFYVPPSSFLLSAFCFFHFPITIFSFSPFLLLPVPYPLHPKTYGPHTILSSNPL